MSDQVLGWTIYDRSRVAKTGFLQLLSEVKSKEADQRSSIQSGSILDLLDRFQLWAGTLGALQPPSRKLSLDERLLDAADIRGQICDYLDDLVGAVQDLSRIVSGDSPNRNMHGGSDDEEEADINETPEDEAHMMLEVISESLRSLFRIAVLVRQASPQDRFKLALHSAPAIPDAFDVTLIEHKYTKLTNINSRWLVNRLGSAIAKRRHFLNYRRDHKSRRSVGHAELSTKVGNRTESQSSKATKFVKANYGDLGSLQVQDDEPDDATSSVAPTASDTEALLKLPRLLDLSPDGQEFECPICFTLQEFTSEEAWTSHAYRDLRPYVCTFNGENCKNRLFEDRNSWFEHELQYHRSHYTCSLCKEGPFTSTSTIVSHIEWYHGTFASDQMSMLVDSGKQVPAYFDSWDCPFCDDWVETPRIHDNRKGKHVSGSKARVMVSSTQFQSHVATHQEQLAVFAFLGATGQTASRSAGAADSLSMDTLSTRVSGVDDQTGSPSRESHHTQSLETVDSLSEHSAHNAEEGRRAVYSVDKQSQGRLQEDSLWDSAGEEHITAGIEEEQIEEDESTDNREGSNDDTHDGLPAFTRMNLNGLDVDSLDLYNIDWEYDAEPGVVLIKRSGPMWEQALLLNHTQKTRFHRETQGKLSKQGKPSDMPESQVTMTLFTESDPSSSSVPATVDHPRPRELGKQDEPEQVQVTASDSGASHGALKIKSHDREQNQDEDLAGQDDGGPSTGPTGEGSFACDQCDQVFEQDHELQQYVHRFWTDSDKHYSV
ncbi:hypothetical protein DL546_009144 [Coniochaeta pulveracea]|uniref:Oxidoreductase acuF-like C2H2 type zinc-finger domain-containing protein n=1 Tax=Coniochaeta pulveracea TaxID=177199 RepID=A0A420YM23_9PEZI|nr:hypothetical protein DL546_009144 [Coniochaeta pulveracea]